MTIAKTKPRRPTESHRKRTGQHHRQSDHYIKAYWPYLPIFAVLIVGALISMGMSHAKHGVLGYATSISSQVLLSDTNAQRTSDHENALKLNNELTAAAQSKANDMATRNYWSHVTPDGLQPSSFVDGSGYQYGAIAENLAYGFGTSDQVIQAWMQSAEHRANILNGTYVDVGFATANAKNYLGKGNETVIVAYYAEPASTTVPAIVTPINFATESAQVSQAQLASHTTWIGIILAVLAGASLMLFFVRHALAWHKVLVRSERFVLHHPYFDTFLISLVVFTFLLSHLAGTIL